MPHMISESGRALTAHHAMLLLKVIDVESQAEPTLPELTEDDHPLLHDMMGDYRDVVASGVRSRRVLEAYHDAVFDKERAQELFSSGVLTLRGRAAAEQIYYAILNAIERIAARHRTDIERSGSRSNRYSSTGTSPTSPCFNRSRTAGRSISSFR